MKAPRNRVRRLVLLVTLGCVTSVAACLALPLFLVGSKQQSLWVGTESFQLELGPRRHPNMLSNSIVLLGPGPLDLRAGASCSSKDSIFDLMNVSLRYWECKP